MTETSGHLHQLETEIRQHGHSEADWEWAREAYSRLLLSQVRSSPARSTVDHAAAEARATNAALAEHHGSAARWAEGRALSWRSESEGLFVEAPGADDVWSWRSALWGIPAVAAGLSVVFAALTLFQWGGEGQDSLAWVLFPGLLAIPVVGTWALYRQVLVVRGYLWGVLAAVLAAAVSIPVITWLVIDALRISLPPEVPWAWVAVAGYVVLAVVAWQVSRRVPGSGAGEGPSSPVSVLPSDQPVTDEAWFSRFRAALHGRGALTDREVRRTIEEAGERVRSTGLTAVEVFGSPWGRARSVPRDPCVAPRRATVGYGLLALIWFALLGSAVMGGGDDSMWWRLALGLLMLWLCLSKAAEWYRAAQGQSSESGATGA